MRALRGVPTIEEADGRFRLSPLLVYLKLGICLETLSPALNRMKR